MQTPPEKSTHRIQQNGTVVDVFSGSSGAALDGERRGFLSPTEFAQQTGLSLSTVRRYIAAGRIPVNQPGGFRGRQLIPWDALLPASLGSHQATEPKGKPSDNPETKPDRLPGRRPAWQLKPRFLPQTN